MKKISLLGLLFLISLSCFGAVTLTDLRCEYRVNPLGIDNTKPRLSWKIIDSEKTRGQRQVGFQVLVASSREKLNQDIGDLWDTSGAHSIQSINNVYGGSALKSGQRCFWKVRVKDVEGNVSDWSPVARFTVGLLNSKDWKGEWIHKGDQEMTDHNWFRKNFTASVLPTSGIVYVGSFGYHELYVNGEKVTDNVMNPVSSFMKKRIPYLTYDISDYLKKGDNVVAIWHAAGWARWKRVKEYKNPPFVFKAQLEIEVDGKMLSVGTDESWKCKASHSEYAGEWDILKFGGERIDARRLELDWNRAEYDDSGWASSSVWKDPVPAQLSAQMVEPQVRYRTIAPKSVIPNKNGTFLIDMGENYTGQFEINLRGGSEGDLVSFEISDQIRRVCNWAQKSEYIFDESGEGVFENRFNLAGGRWITVTGLKSKPELDDIKGYVITSDRKRISQFECSNDLLNQIYQVNLDTYLANTIDGILVDCPHRERRAWGEVTVAAMYGDALPNFESGAYMNQYAQYLVDSQSRQGEMRAIVNGEEFKFLMWKANSPITIWETYRMLGDKKLLHDHYPALKKWMTWLFKNSNYKTGGGLIIGEQGKMDFPGLGDWCTPKGNFWTSSNSPEAAHFNNCLYAYMLECAHEIASVLGNDADANIYADRLMVQRKATHQQIYDPATGDYGTGQQVNQAFALISGVTPEAEVKKVYNNLVDEMLYAFPYYDTGSSGQALYTRYFTEHGERMDLIYELLTDTRHPSYGYFIRTGANVWPERWSGIGGSRIHTCYTGIGGYFIKGFGGIRPDPENYGFQGFIIKPAPVGDLTYANTEFESLYGNIIVNWKRSNDSASYHIEVPPNTTAKVYLPALGKQHVSERGSLAEKSIGVKYLGTEKNDAVGNYVIFKVTSGVYDFTVADPPKTVYPSPKYTGSNLTMIGRMNASSMFIAHEKNPGFEAFKANDNNPETSWKAGGNKGQWLEVEWITPQTFSKVVIREVGEVITKHKVQYWNGDTWVDLAKGDTCGEERLHTFDAVTAEKCRLLIEKAGEAPSIAELSIQ